MSRAWMKDAADAHARDCPNIKRIIKQFNRISRWVASDILRVTDDAQMRLSMLKRFVELAHCCRDVQNLHAHVRRLRRPQPVGRAALKGLWEKLPTKWEKRYAELDQLCNPKSNSAAMRCCAASTK
jgi:Rap guanine nucleotide exchange factor 6